MTTRSNIYFLSDFHLGAKYFPSQREAELRIVDFLTQISNDAKEIYLVGDILDYWFEYRNVVPRGHIRFFGKLAEMSDMGIKITWLIGNHDIWIFDYLPSELGIEVIDGYIERTLYGKRFFITHGDGVGKRSASFQFIRNIFRNKICQRLYSAIHPRWTIPFALSWSESSRKKPDIVPDYRGLTQEPTMQFALEHSQRNSKTDFYIFGHRHLAVEEQLPTGAKAIILGEWITLFSYAVFDGKELKLSKFTPK